MLEAYALMTHDRPHGTDLTALLHRGEHVAGARQRLAGLICELLADGARAGQVRADVPPAELAGYCLHALSAAGGLPSRAAVRPAGRRHAGRPAPLIAGRPLVWAMSGRCRGCVTGACGLQDGP